MHVLFSHSFCVVHAVNNEKDLIEIDHWPSSAVTACPIRGLLLLAMTCGMDGGEGGLPLIYPVLGTKTGASAFSCR